MIKIDDILIEDAVINSNFSCDLNKCKGACCTMEGEFGAPLAESELQEMRDNFNAAAKYLSKDNIEYIKEFGFFEFDGDSLSTVVIDNRDCVFVYYDGDIAKCSFEKAFFAGESSFRKPVSCHLFPIRASYFGANYIYYSVIDECKSARQNGERLKAPLFSAVKDALVRKFGQNWTNAFELYLKSSKNESAKDNLKGNEK